VDGAATKVFEGRYIVNAGGGNFQRIFDYVGNYDIAADGQRFLMIKATGSDAPGARRRSSSSSTLTRN
jgi:hypothetical protein